MELIVQVISFVTIILSVINYSTLQREDVGLVLNYKVKEFLIALGALILIITLKVVFGCTLLEGMVKSPLMVKKGLTIVLLTFFLVYNVGLMVVLLRGGMKPEVGCEIWNLIMSGIVLYLFFDKVGIGKYADVVAWVFLLSLLYLSLRVNSYVKVMRELVEPVNVVGPTKVFVVSGYLTALAGLVNDLNIARAFFTFAMITATLSLLSFELEVRKILNIIKK